MSVVDSTIHTAENTDRAHVSEASYIQRKIEENATKRNHEYVILLMEGEEVTEASFSGTPAGRLEYLENSPTDDVAPGLGLNPESDPWAAGYFDQKDRVWKVCGTDLALKHMIATRPRPVG